MDQILNMSSEERAQIYKEAAARSNNIKLPIIFEKDFWVCWTLKQIFTISEINPHITFKGGTSLSKCFNIINRFSEDCDLTLSKDFLEIAEDTETVANMGSNQKRKFLDNLTQKSEYKINDVIKPILITRFREELSLNYRDDEWKIETDPEEAQNLIFHYPLTIKDNKGDGYIQAKVKLEFGARGDTTPNEDKNISSYIHETLPELFDTPTISVKTLTAKRTFWEKVTLLHAERHRKPDSLLRARMFRHYYDIAMLENAGITEAALKDTDLLEIVVKNKQTFFPSGWANYHTAKIGSICLSPNDVFKDALKQDCSKMADMFFGQQPDFDEVMGIVKDMEKSINSVQRL